MQIDRRLVGASVWLAMSVTCGGVAFAAEIPTPGEQYQAAIAASYTAIETTGGLRESTGNDTYSWVNRAWQDTKGRWLRALTESPVTLNGKTDMFYGRGSQWLKFGSMGLAPINQWQRRLLRINGMRRIIGIRQPTPTGLRTLLDGVPAAHDVPDKATTVGATTTFEWQDPEVAEFKRWVVAENGVIVNYHESQMPTRFSDFRYGSVRRTPWRPTAFATEDRARAVGLEDAGLIPSHTKSWIGQELQSAILNSRARVGVLSNTQWQTYFHRIRITNASHTRVVANDRTGRYRSEVSLVVRNAARTVRYRLSLTTSKHRVEVFRRFVTVHRR